MNSIATMKDGAMTSRGIHWLRRAAFEMGEVMGM
jgi:hypothetical protein